MKWWKPEDGVIEGALRVAAIGTLIFAIVVYRTTIYPVFSKENELKDAKGEVEKLRTEGIRLTADNKATEEKAKQLQAEVAERARRIEDLRRQFGDKEVELRALQSRANQLQVELSNATLEAVNAHIFRALSDIVDEGIREEARMNIRGEKVDIDYQKRTIEVAQKGMKDSKPDTYEYKAFAVIEVFARDVLQPKSAEWRPVFNLMTFGRYDPRALKIIYGH
ncbi:MAG: hypothetical protein QM775_00340 [Pirellulales bacterium]